MIKKIGSKINAVFWAWKNRRVIIPLLQYEIGSRFSSSNYSLTELEGRIERLGIILLDMPDLLRRERMPQQGPTYFRYYESVRGLSPYELLVLCSLVKGKRKILELGTYKGLTSVHLAHNSAARSVIHTLDLPEEMIKGTYRVGEYIKNDPIFSIMVWDDFDPVHHRETCFGVIDAVEKKRDLLKGVRLYKLKGTKFLILCKG